MPWFMRASLVGNSSYMLLHVIAGRVTCCPWDSTGSTTGSWARWTLPGVPFLLPIFIGIFPLEQTIVLSAPGFLDPESHLVTH